MANKQRKIEIFSAGCPVCEEVIQQVKHAACPSCDVQVLDMKSPDVQRHAARLGVKSVPAVAIEGKLADCCANRGVDIGALRAAGLGQAIG
ncbi:MAG: thioredoxin family protein [Alphaproteobacteria bacterium]